MALPARRKPPRSGIERAPRREFPAHRKFVRGHECSMPDCEYRGDPRFPIECAHISYGLPPEDAAGVGMKSHDAWSISLCSYCHRTCHGWGHETAFRMEGIDPHKLAVEFAKASPVPEIRAKVPSMQAWLARGAS